MLAFLSRTDQLAVVKAASTIYSVQATGPTVHLRQGTSISRGCRRNKLINIPGKSSLVSMFSADLRRHRFQLLQINNATRERSVASRCRNARMRKMYDVKDQLSSSRRFVFVHFRLSRHVEHKICCVVISDASTIHTDYKDSCISLRTVKITANLCVWREYVIQFEVIMISCMKCDKRQAGQLAITLSLKSVFTATLYFDYLT